MSIHQQTQNPMQAAKVSPDSGASQGAPRAALLHKAGSAGWSPRGMTAPKGAKTRDKTTNWATYNAALKARGSLTI
jgi:hypothetical protein